MIIFQTQPPSYQFLTGLQQPPSTTATVAEAMRIINQE